ncbi:unnamed protein product [Phaeothamnion confervicola]
MPEICPFLGLGLYLLSFRVGGQENRRLFPGNDQYQRFSSFLGRKAQERSGELAAFGVKPADIGTHSARKGSATYVASGSTACPPMPAICMRAGWSMGSIQDRYIRYESAGDQYVGRTVSGLPLSTHDFCVLPPHFCKKDANGTVIPGVTELVTMAVSDCFGGDLTPRLKEVAEHLLASVVYHQDYLRRTLHPRHPAWDSALFMQSGLLERLTKHVVLLHDGDTLGLRATGVPPHVSILKSLRTVLTEVTSIRVSWHHLLLPVRFLFVFLHVDWQ